MAHTANFSMAAPEEVFSKCLIIHRLWPSRSPDLNLCNHCLWGILKDRVYVNNLYSSQELKDNIERKKLLIFQDTSSTVCQEISSEGVRPA
jgi:hypothetical protein